MFESNDAIGIGNEYKMNPVDKDSSSEHSSSGQFSVTGSSSPSGGGNAINTLICPGCGLQVPQSLRICPNDGTDLLLQTGEVFAEKFELLGLIGSGGMGVIYRARHLILDKVFAIKVLHANANDPSLIMRFQREAKAASSLSHPNLITINDFGILNGTQPYMVMDYIPGRTLSDYLDERGTLTVDEALEFFGQIVNGVVHAHKKGVLHRDLKPSNIMLIEEINEPRHLKILDFGLAKLVDRDDQISLSATGAALGSPAYMSPEQATGMKSDRRCDLYSLGCILYEMLIGSPPLLGNSPTETLIRRLNEEVPPLSDKSVRTFPASVEELVIRLLQRDPQDRFQSAEEVRDVVEQLLRTCKDEYSSISFSINPEDGGTSSGTYGAIAAISGAAGSVSGAHGSTGGGIYGATDVTPGAQNDPEQSNGSASGGTKEPWPARPAAITPDTSSQEPEQRSQPPRRNHPRNTIKDMTPTNPLTDPHSAVRDHSRRVGERPARNSRTDMRSPGVPSVRVDARDASCRVRSRNSDPSLPAIQSPKAGRGSGQRPAVRKPYHLRPERQSALGQDLLRRISELPPAIIVTLIMIVLVTLWLLVSLIAR